MELDIMSVVRGLNDTTHDHIVWMHSSLVSEGVGYYARRSWYQLH